MDSDTGDINDARDALLVDSQRLFAMPGFIGVDVPWTLQIIGTFFLCGRLFIGGGRDV